MIRCLENERTVYLRNLYGKLREVLFIALKFLTSLRFKTYCMFRVYYKWIIDVLHVTEKPSHPYLSYVKIIVVV